MKKQNRNSVRSHRHVQDSQPKEKVNKPNSHRKKNRCHAATVCVIIIFWCHPLLRSQRSNFQLLNRTWPLPPAAPHPPKGQNATVQRLHGSLSPQKPLSPCGPHFIHQLLSKSHRHPTLSSQFRSPCSFASRSSLRRRCCQPGAGRHRRSGAHRQHCTCLTLVRTR